MENRRALLGDELRLQSVFIKLAWASSAGIISTVFIAVAYQPGAGNQTPASLQGITAMETLLLPFPPAAGGRYPLVQA